MPTANDIVLADLSLPRVSGLELLDRIKRSWPMTEVIVITGHGDFKTGAQAVQQGALYLPKPVDLAELRAIVEKTPLAQFSSTTSRA